MSEAGAATRVDEEAFLAVSSSTISLPFIVASKSSIDEVWDEFKFGKVVFEEVVSDVILFVVELNELLLLALSSLV